MGNDVKFPKLNIFLEVVEMYVRMFYVIALIYPVGGLLWRWFSPTTKGFGLEEGQFKLPIFDKQTHTYKTTWQDLMLMVQGIDTGNCTRRKRWNPHEKRR